MWVVVCVGVLVGVGEAEAARKRRAWRRTVGRSMVMVGVSLVGRLSWFVNFVIANVALTWWCRSTQLSAICSEKVNVEV